MPAYPITPASEDYGIFDQEDFRNWVERLFRLKMKLQHVQWRSALTTQVSCTDSFCGSWAYL